MPLTIIGVFMTSRDELFTISREVPLGMGMDDELLVRFICAEANANVSQNIDLYEYFIVRELVKASHP